MVASYTPKKKLKVAEAKLEVIRLIEEGSSINDAMTEVGRGRSLWDEWRRTDGDFRNTGDLVLASARNAIDGKRNSRTVRRVEVPDFPEFCHKYLKQDLYYHQLQWYDILEGRAPRDLHPAETYIPGKQTRLIVNTPPGHAKSTTISVNYVLWRIIKNPDMRIVICSKTEALAKDFVYQISEILTSGEYEELQKDFAPSGGFKGDKWTEKAIRINGKQTTEKDFTVKAIGMGAQLYGTRADLIIVDDAVDNLNHGEFDKQVKWMNTIVSSRLTSRTGKLLVIGTRIASSDMYVELLNPSRYSSGVSPYSYLLQPAVLNYADDPRDWKTLWPYSNYNLEIEEEYEEDDSLRPPEGLFRAKDGPTLAAIRDEMDLSDWSRVYMQEQVSEDSLFKPEVIAECVDGRQPGIIPNIANLGREKGMDGLYVVAGLDPSTAGFTAFCVYGVDMLSDHKDRYIIDLHNESWMKPDALKNKIKEFTLKYDVKEWRIERNAFQAFLTRDVELLTWLSTRGSKIIEHYTTGSNKHDPDVGVAAMSVLFEQKLIHLPNRNSAVVKALMDQLTVWEPISQSQRKRTIKDDLVMALWFAEIRALEIARKSTQESFYENNSKFLSKRVKRNKQATMYRAS